MNSNENDNELKKLKEENLRLREKLDGLLLESLENGGVIDTAVYIMNTMPNPAFVVNEKASIIKFNAHAEEVFLSKGEGYSIFDIFPEDKEVVQQSLAQLKESGKSCRDKLKKGAGVYESIFVPVYDSIAQKKYIIVSLRDISAQHERSERFDFISGFSSILNETSQKLIGMASEEIGSLISSALEIFGLYTKVARTYIFVFNEEHDKFSAAYEWHAEGLKGFDEEYKDIPVAISDYVIPRLIKFQDLIISSPDDIPEKNSKDIELMKSYKVMSVALIPMGFGSRIVGFLGFQTCDEKRQWDESTVRLFWLAGGILASALVRKRVDDAFKMYALELEKSNQEIKSFNHIITHDLRAPIANIKGFSYELKDEYEMLTKIFENDCNGKLGKDTEEILDKSFHKNIPLYIKHLTQSTAKMEYLTNSVLEWFRAGRREIKIERLDGEKLVAEVLADFKHKMHEKNIELELGRLLDIYADVESAKQVFSNLIDNAVKYMDRKNDGLIQISSEYNQEGIAVYSISDNGQGIKESEIKNIFHLFQRSGSQTVQGEGIGLTYVKTLIEKHGGRIKCISDFGKGSTFTFYFAKPLRLV